jgi:hypothetical protein
MASSYRRSRDSLKGWKKVEKEFKAIQPDFDCKWRPLKYCAVLGLVTLFLSLTLLSGCFRDPNVRKHKYLESGQRYSAQGIMRIGEDLSSSGSVQLRFRRTPEDR